MKCLAFKFIALVTMTGVFVSCEKPNVQPNKPPTANTTDLPKEIRSSEGFYVKLQYGSDGKLVKSLSYDNDGVLDAYYINEYTSTVVKSKLYEPGKTDPQGTATYTINTNGYIVKEVLMNINDLPAHSTRPSSEYEYDANGYLVKCTEKDNSSGSSSITIYQYAGGNLISSNKTVNDVMNPYTVNTTYEYYPEEDKLASRNFNFENLPSPHTNYGKANKNMLKKRISKWSNEAYDHEDLYTYEYNANGYPIKIINKQKTNGFPPDTVIEIIY